MSVVAAQQALIRRVLTMPGRPGIVLPNHRGPYPPPPRYVVQVSAAAQVRLGISPYTDATAEIVVRVETADAAFAGDSDALVQALVDRFPLGARFDGVTVVDRPLPRPPFHADGLYVAPVIVRGRTFF